MSCPNFQDLAGRQHNSKCAVPGAKRGDQAIREEQSTPQPPQTALPMHKFRGRVGNHGTTSAELAVAHRNIASSQKTGLQQQQHGLVLVQDYDCVMLQTQLFRPKLHEY